MTYPIIDLAGPTVTARLTSGHAVSTVPVTCVVDFNAFDDPLGIEIIGFKDQLGHEPPTAPPLSERNELSEERSRWSYDPKIDAFYLHIKREQAPKQKELLGSAALDRGGFVVSLCIDLTSEIESD